MILVDSSVWINFFNGKNTNQTKKLELSLGSRLVFIGDIIKIEVLQGFLSDKDFKVAEDLMANFDQVALLDEKTVDESVKIYRSLRKKGITIRKTIDVIIAAYCIENNVSLLTEDKDFTNIAKHTSLKLL